MTNAVAYLRVSTKGQGKSRLGLEAQNDAIEDFKKLFNVTIIQEYIEVESGKKNNRKQLKKAIRFCKKTGTMLIFAKIDRLSRDALFVAMLLAQNIKVKAADKPQATILDLLEDAIRAEREGQVISQRTKEALRMAKKRGVELGKNGKVLAEQNKKASVEFAQQVAPMIEQIQLDGIISVNDITNQLNKRKIPTYRPGSRWHKSTVHNVIKIIRTEAALKVSETHLV